MLLDALLEDELDAEELLDDAEELDAEELLSDEELLDAEELEALLELLDKLGSGMPTLLFFTTQFEIVAMQRENNHE